jgi:hypothetical protein
MIGAILTAAVVMAQATPAATLPATAPVTPGPSAAAATTVSPLTVTPQIPVSKRRDVDLREVVCRDELPVGSRFPVKVCASRGEFKERTRQNQELIRDWQRTPIG